MTADSETLAVYQARAAEYAACFASEAPDRALSKFMAALPPGGPVLDLGCGPGGAAVALMAAGFDVEAMDAAQAMVDIAVSHGVRAGLGTFEDVTATARYDGVWANFSLLHAPRAALPRHIAAIRRALKPGGHFHIGMKLGQGETRDRLGRKYTFVTREELGDLLAGAGMVPVWENSFVEKGLAGTNDPGITLLARASADD